MTHVTYSIVYVIVGPSSSSLELNPVVADFSELQDLPINASVNDFMVGMKLRHLTRRLAGRSMTLGMLWDGMK